MVRIGCQMSKEDLQRDLAMQLRVACAIDVPHSTGSDGFQDLVGANSGSAYHRQTPGQRWPLCRQLHCRPVEEAVWIVVLLEQRLDLPAHRGIRATDVIEEVGPLFTTQIACAVVCVLDFVPQSHYSQSGASA